MKPTISTAALALSLLSGLSLLNPGQAAEPPIALAIHGGAGTWEKVKMTPERRKTYEHDLTQALQAGYAVLKTGGSSLDAVEASVRVLEDSPLFNAGKGAVFTHDGTHELDASIMDGKTLAAGAVAGVKHIRNPISLARAVMEKSPHVLLAGSGAEAFAQSQGFALVEGSYFDTPEKWQLLQEVQAEEAKAKVRGTVGAVALDRAGNLAAATSTGGMTNKRWGRVGDSPIIGAGTYANNATCAVSATGHGEYFIRSVVAHDISALMAYGKLSLKAAADEVVMRKLKDLGGEGGVIAVDRQGNVTTPFNTEGMYRGWVTREGQLQVKIYNE
ncbi:MAG: isoaspartyl peptidase/L-asparaginase family protein [Candidatus Sericytochromatia bacterium]